MMKIINTTSPAAPRSIFSSDADDTRNATTLVHPPLRLRPTFITSVRAAKVPHGATRGDYPNHRCGGALEKRVQGLPLYTIIIMCVTERCQLFKRNTEPPVSAIIISYLHYAGIILTTFNRSNRINFERFEKFVEVQQRQQQQL